MNQKIRITTRAGQFEQRKQEHLQMNSHSPSIGSAHSPRYARLRMTIALLR
jgi:hypothetical protein